MTKNVEDITLEDVTKIFDYLKEDMHLTPNKSMNIILFLQEHMNIIPSHYEMCYKCKTMHDSNNEGIYDDKKGKWYCDDCRKD